MSVLCHYAHLPRLSVARPARRRTLRTVAMVMTLIACVSSVGCMVALTQMPAKMTALFLAIANDKNVILFLINILLLVFGCLIDMVPSILICTPILLPVMVNFGVDPVHFGMIMLLNLGIGGAIRQSAHPVRQRCGRRGVDARYLHPGNLSVATAVAL